MAIQVVPLPGSNEGWRAVRVGRGESFSSRHDTKQAAIRAAKREAQSGEEITATNAQGRNETVVRSGDNGQAENGNGEMDDDGGLPQRIANFRERIQRRETAKRAERRASARRVQEGEPETASEKIKVTAQESKELARDATQLVKTELGIESNEKAKETVSNLADIVSAPDAQETLDLDGDGDTDALNFFDRDAERQDFDASEPLPGEIDFGREESRARRGQRRAIEEGRATNVERKLDPSTREQGTQAERGRRRAIEAGVPTNVEREMLEEL